MFVIMTDLTFIVNFSGFFWVLSKIPGNKSIITIRIGPTYPWAERDWKTGPLYLNYRNFYLFVCRPPMYFDIILWCTSLKFLDFSSDLMFSAKNLVLHAHLGTHGTGLQVAENNWIYICSIDFHKETEYYNTAYKVSVFGVILVCIFPHSDWIRRDTDQNNSEYGHFLRSVIYNQPNIYLFKFNNRNTRKRYEIYSKLIIKTLERRQWLLFVCWKVVQLKCFRIQLI